MTTILHLRKQLTFSPAVASLPGIAVRTIRIPDDIDAWLALRERAVAGLVPQPRPWLHQDYIAEMFDKPWFHGDRNWLATGRESPSKPIGAVTLAMRTGASDTMPVVHWLLVDPEYRRRGIARLLMAHLERAAWEAGLRRIELETHRAWIDAVAFYQSIGYEPACERLSR